MVAEVFARDKRQLSTVILALPAVLALLLAPPAQAQQNCPATPAAGTANTTCANTAFVQKQAAASFASPPAIGSTTPNTGAFTALTTSAPNNQTGATYVVAAGDYSIVGNNAGGTLTLTLPTAASNAGRWLIVKTTQNQTVVSASSNVGPLAGGAVGTAILAATAGKWAMLQCDGTNWIIMAAN